MRWWFVAALTLAGCVAPSAGNGPEATTAEGAGCASDHPTTVGAALEKEGWSVPVPAWRAGQWWTFARNGTDPHTVQVVEEAWHGGGVDLVLLARAPGRGPIDLEEAGGYDLVAVDARGFTLLRGWDEGGLAAERGHEEEDSFWLGASWSSASPPGPFVRFPMAAGSSWTASDANDGAVVLFFFYDKDTTVTGSPAGWRRVCVEGLGEREAVHVRLVRRTSGLAFIVPYSSTHPHAVEVYHSPVDGVPLRIDSPAWHAASPAHRWLVPERLWGQAARVELVAAGDAGDAGDARLPGDLEAFWRAHAHRVAQRGGPSLGNLSQEADVTEGGALRPAVGSVEGTPAAAASEWTWTLWDRDGSQVLRTSGGSAPVLDTGPGAWFLAAEARRQGETLAAAVGTAELRHASRADVACGRTAQAGQEPCTLAEIPVVPHARVTVSFAPADAANPTACPLALCGTWRLLDAAGRSVFQEEWPGPGVARTVEDTTPHAAGTWRLEWTRGPGSTTVAVDASVDPHPLPERDLAAWDLA